MPIRFSDFSTKPKEQYTYNIYQYYLAKRALCDYSQAVALFGTRRLGKTVVLNQLWDKFHTAKSIYLKIEEGSLVEDILPYIQSKDDIDYLFIDEITNIDSLDSQAAILLDFCSAYNIKVVTTGTNSYLLAEAIHDSAIGRFNVIRFNPQNYIDLLHLKHADLHNYILGNTSLYLGDNYLEDITHDVLKAIDSLGNYKNEPLSTIDFDELYINIEIIIELIILNKENKLPRNGLIFRRRFYKNLDFDLVVTKTQSKKEVVQYVYKILLRTGLLIELPVKSLSDETTTYKLYLTTPVIYRNLLDKYNLTEKNTRLGTLFESFVVSQFYQLLQDKAKYKIYTFRDDVEDIEVDLVLRDDNQYKFYMIEIKYSASKYGKYKNNTELKKAFSPYEIIYIDINPDNYLNVYNKFKMLITNTTNDQQTNLFS